MELNGITMCDFCFERISPGAPCPNCGLTHETYNADAGLLMPGANLLGKYIIGRVLGRGGFGATYLAYSHDRKQPVAIKEYFPTNIANRAKGEEKISIVSDDKVKVFEKGANRFFEEAKTMSRFNTNRNVVSVYEFFYANDTVYYSMEYLRGIDLKGYVAKRGGRLSQGEAISVLRGICEALVAVHSTQTLHRDISPDNVFITTNGEVKLIDFGAAKQVVGEHAQQNYSVVVKQGFAPAEQYKSNGRQGVWTDLYAAGATAYYILTGEVPLDAINRVENPEIAFRPELNIMPQFAAIIRKCLRSKPEERYQSAIELLGAVDQLNIAPEPLGGAGYVQGIYSGPAHTELHGNAVAFGGATPGQQTGYNPFTGNPQYPNSHNTQAQYQPNMSYYQPSGYAPAEQEDKKGAMIRGIIIGAEILIIIALIVVIAVALMSEPEAVQISSQSGMLANDVLPIQ